MNIQGKTGRSRTESKGGFLTKLNRLLERDRLGELLVVHGLLTPQSLRVALAHQRTDKLSLGRTLVSRRMINRSDLYRVLAHQWALRSLAALVTFSITFSFFASAKAQASPLLDIPPQVRLASAANAAFAPLESHPALFGTDEKRSTNLAPFTKWSGMFARFNQEMNEPSRQRTEQKWLASLSPMAGLPIEQMADGVNTMVNQVAYIEDQNNWGVSDYWETPLEFFARGGDCEDFAIAKYASLRALGVPSERLRIAIVQDTLKNIPHAILIVYTDHDALILDNQSPKVRSSSAVDRYRPIFSLGQNAWWLHTGTRDTMVASAD